MKSDHYFWVLINCVILFGDNAYFAMKTINVIISFDKNSVQPIFSFQIVIHYIDLILIFITNYVTRTCFLDIDIIRFNNLFSFSGL